MPLAAALAISGSLCVGLPGCADAGRAEGFQEADPAARMRAIRGAAGANDRESLRDLIRSLESDDPAERLLASQALSRRTGLSFGFDYAADRSSRQAAVQRWVDWYQGVGSADSARSFGQDPD